jgi:hypothetical protein
MVNSVQLLGDKCSDPKGFYKYQSYYIQGFKQITQIDFDIRPIYSKLCAVLDEGRIKGAHRVWELCNTLLNKSLTVESNHVGRYLFTIEGRRIKVAIDVSDGREIRDWQAYGWCHIYFKANKWTTLSYPPKVCPVVNGNGLLNHSKINHLKQLRSRTKEVDIIFMTVIYASSDKQYFYNNIEHHIRLFETLAKLNCSKILKAVIPQQYPMEEMKPYLDRLERIGVPWSYSWDGMPSHKFWDHLAKSRIVFLRPGKHGCISWRMIDLLSMGACVVYDGHPYPNWPVPLIAGRNFLECGCGLGMEESLPPMKAYDAMIPAIEHLLNCESKMTAIRKANADYFDRYANPVGVADYILQRVREVKTVENLSEKLIPFEQTC